MNLQKHEVNKLLESVSVEYLGFVRASKSYLDEHLIGMIGKSAAITIVMDVNLFLPECESYLKRGKSFMVTLFGCPFLKVNVPYHFVNEVEDKLGPFCKAKGIDYDRAKQFLSWFYTRVRIMEPDEISKIHALERVGKRDPKDAPYLALYLSIGATGILTKDKDLQLGGVRVFSSTKKLGHILTISERGALSFFILGNATEPFFRTLFSVVAVVFKSIIEFFDALGREAYSMLRAAGRAISRLSEEAQLLLVFVSIAILSNQENLEKIKAVLSQVSTAVIAFFKVVWAFFKWICTAIFEVLSFGVQAYHILSENAQETMNVFLGIEKATTKG